MILQIYIPAKTFIAGEYLALHEGPVLVALTGPAFTASFYKNNGSTFAEASDFHKDSPAGKFIYKNAQAFNNIKIVFNDRVKSGGFGASTAQFLTVYSWFLIGQGLNPTEVNLQELLSEYLKYAYSGEGMPPSGADLVGQLKGQLCYFDKSMMQIRKSSWPFKNLNFYLIQTGTKLATHEHLQDLSYFDSSGLKVSFEKLYEGLLEKDDALFCEGIQDYALELEKLGFTCESSLTLLKEIKNLSGVEAAKACGAMGADVLVVFYKSNEDAELNKWIKLRELKIIATNKDICEGLVYEHS